MTEIQLPLHTNHQKGMNGKFLPKNTLEIRGGGVGNSNVTTANELAKSSGSAKKASIKLIEKTPANLANIQVYPIKLNSNSEKLDSFSTIVSVNFIDVKSSTARNRANSNTNRNSRLIDNSFANDLQLTASTNILNFNNPNILQANTSQHNIHNQTSHPWNDECNSGWTSTGVMSDRSSVYSIDDGDFDREASRKVGNQLRAIESVLYEQTSTDSSSYINECKEWLEKFPHLRILGSQMSSHSTKDDLLQSNLENTRSSTTYRQISNSLSLNTSLSPFINSSSNLTKSLTNDASITQKNQITKARRENTDINNQGLYLNGYSMPIQKLNLDDLTNSREDFTFLEEEIIEQEGEYEELLAYDNQEEEYLFEHNKRLNLNKRRKHGLPPITPKASMKDLVTNFLFDHMWSELIDWSMDLIKEYAKTVLDNEMYFNPSSGRKTPQAIEIPEKQSIKQESTPNTHLYNNQNHNAYLANNTGKPSVVQLKPFDPPVNNNVNNNTSNNNNSNSLYSNLMDKQSFTSGLSRDNSILYNQSNSNTTKVSNAELLEKFGYSESVSTVGELIPASNFGDLLKIKQINRNGLNNPINKNLTPLGVQNRIGSGGRKQTINNFKKRYTSIEISSNTNILDKNIIIHGAGLGKSNQENSNGSLYASGVAQINRSNNSSSQAYHNPSNLDEHNSSYDNDYSEYNYSNFNDIAESSVDEINVLNTNTNSNFNRNYYYNNNHLHYNHAYLKSNNNHPQLPPIGSSLTSKPLRISSANNLKTTKEKSERPMTSTATRHENFLINKRSTTPSGQINTNKTFSNLYPINMKITGIRLSSEEPFYQNGNGTSSQTSTLSNFLSTKSFGSINTSNTNANIQNSLVQQASNRRNSIKDAQGFQRIHK